MENLMVTLVFAETIFVLSEQQNPVFRQKPTLPPNFWYISDILLRTNLYDVKFCVDSKSATKNVVAPRNLEEIWKNRLFIFTHLVVYVVATERVENEN